MVVETAPGAIDLVDIRARVKRGARLLDDRAPCWAVLVNDDELAMQWCNGCILGQVFGNYVAALEFLGVWGRSSVYHGFDLIKAEVDDSSYAPAWEVLADAWRAEVRARLAPSAPQGGEEAGGGL